MRWCRVTLTRIHSISLVSVIVDVNMLASVQRRMLIHNATSPDEEPTPAYVLEEICTETQINDEACQGVRDVLLSRLRHNSPYTKAKCLRIIKYVCNHGSPSFRQDLTRRTEVVRELQSFRGDMHPLLGDSVNAQVRKLAHESIASIFEEHRGAVGVGRPMEGFGAVQGGYSIDKSTFDETNIRTDGPTANKYSGFGNPNFSDNRRGVEGKYVGYATEAVNQAKLAAEHVYSVGARVLGQTSSSRAQSTRLLEMSGPHARYEPANYQPEENVNHGVTLVPGPLSTLSTPIQYNIKSTIREETIVEEFTSVRGMSSMPDRSSLDNFTRRCASSDVGALSAAIIARLSVRDKAQVILRALCALEGLIICGQPVGLVDYFCKTEGKQIVQEAARSAHRQIRERGLAVIKLLQPHDAVLPKSLHGNESISAAMQDQSLEELLGLESTAMRSEGDSLESGFSFMKPIGEVCEHSTKSNADNFSQNEISMEEGKSIKANEEIPLSLLSEIKVREPSNRRGLRADSGSKRNDAFDFVEEHLLAMRKKH